MDNVEIIDLGAVLVDSGQIAISDPASYELAKKRGELLTFSTEVGDGVFPVYMIKENFGEEDEQEGLKSIQVIIDIIDLSDDLVAQ